MRYLVTILLVWGLGYGVSGCRTQRSLTKTRTETTMTTKDSVHAVIQQTMTVKEYDDTLRATSFIPIIGSVSASLNDQLSDRTVTAESKGIKMIAIVTPRKDSAGRIIGNDVHLEAIAKPVSVKESNQVSVVSGSTSLTNHSSTTLTNRTKTKPWLSLPWWVWMIGAGVIIVVIIRFGKKYFKYFI